MSEGKKAPGKGVLKSAKAAFSRREKTAEPEATARPKKDFTSEIHQIFAKNLKALLGHRSWSNRKLYLRSEVSDRYIAHLLEREHTPTLEVVEKLAIAFNVQPWQLLLPDMNIPTIETGYLTRLLVLFMSLDLATQGYIVKKLEKEFSADVIS